jgi:transcription antitermination factor NusG
MERQKKELEIPLLPSYLFVNVSAKEMWSVLVLNGVVRYVSCEGKPVALTDTQGLEGMYLSDKNGSKVYMQLEVIKQSVAVEVPAYFVDRISS